MPSPPRARPRLTRRLLVAAAGVIVLLLLLALALPLLVDVNRYRGLIQTKAEAALGRKVSLGTMSLSMFPLPGIEVKDVEVAGLLKASSLEIRVKLLSLLSGAPQVRRLVLNQPEITLRRAADGKWDLPLADREASGAESAQHERTAISLSGLKVNDGVVRLRDASLGGRPFELDVQLDLSASIDLRHSGDLDCELEGSVEAAGLVMQARGTVRRHGGEAGETTADITLDRAQVELARLRELTELVGHEWPIPDELIAPGPVTLGARLQLHQPAGRPAALTLSDVVVSGLKITIAQDALGRWSWEQDSPVPAPPAVRPEAGPEVAVRNLRIADASLRLGGAPGKPGGLTVEDLTLIVEEIAPEKPLTFQLSGKLDRGGRIEAGGAMPGRLSLDVSLGGSDIKGTVSIERTDPVVASMDLSSRRTDFGELTEILESLKPAASSTKASAGSTASSGGGSHADIRGQLAIAAGSFGGMEFSDLKSTLVMQRDTVRLDPVAMTLYGGRMQGAIGMDTGASPASYTVTSQAESINAGALLDAALDLGDTLTGTLSGQFTIAAAGATRDEVLAAARGQGRLSLTSGRVGALDVLGVLSKASGVLGERSLAQVSQAMATQGTEFSELSATIQVRGGKIFSDDLKLESTDLSLAGAGWVDMRAAALEMAGEIDFSQKMSQAMADEGSRAAEVFWDSRTSRVSLPLTLAGPVASPMPGIDWQKAGGKLARRKVEEALGSKLEQAGLGGLFKKGTAPVRQAPGPAAHDAAPVDPGALDAVLEESDFSGDLLAPDLKLKGQLRGTGLDRAELTVRDGSGRAVHAESFKEKIRKYYETHDPGAPAAINFRVTVDGKRLAAAGRGSLEVFVTLTDASGSTLEKRFEVDR